MNNNLLTVLVIIVFIGLLIGLAQMKKMKFSFNVRVVAALAIGIVFGGVLQLIFGYGSEILNNANSWIGVVGTGYVRLLKMIVFPLIFISICSAIITQRAGNLGKVASRILLVLLGTVAISTIIGALITAGFGLTAAGLQSGKAEIDKAAKLGEQLVNIKANPIYLQLVQIIPDNPFYALAGQGSNATLSTVFFAVVLGVSGLQLKKSKKETGEKFEGFIKMLHDVVMRMVQMILRLTPYGVFALMTKITSGSNYQDILRLIGFVGASYLAIAIMFVVHGIIVALFGLSPIKFFKKSATNLLFAFTSRSSSGTLPLTVENMTDNLGVPEGTANLAGSLGTCIGQNGCAGIYPAMLAVMIAPTMGINPLDPVFLVRLVIIVSISSFGIAGVGGGATFAALTVLSALGFPVELAGLLVAIEPLIDMARTALNVSDSLVAGVVTAKNMKELDVEVYNSNLE